MAIGGLRGAGPVTAARLRAHGIETARDLLGRLPRRYDDLRRETALGALGAVPDGAVVLVRGTVRRVQAFPRRFLFVTLEQDGAEVRAEWFRARGAMAKSFPRGAEVVLAGPLRTAEGGARCLTHPTNLTAAQMDRMTGRAGAEGMGLRPRYPPIEGVGGRLFERLVAAALERLAGDVPEILPSEARARLGLPALAEAWRAVHAPSDDLDAEAVAALVAGQSPAHRRMALEELLVVQAAFLLRRAEVRAAPAPAGAGIDVGALARRLEQALGFSLSPSQARAVSDIGRDMAGTAPMQRLLLGDVGSGKTVVALAAAALAAGAGGQALMMAPTEVLAEQHARTLGPVAARLGITTGALTGTTPAAARRELLAAFAAGRLHLLIGTHALLHDEVRAADLRLCVVDEQHRFGVAQRARLGNGAGGQPHLLVLSATPIPRTLALALHGDLDASALTERPAGRSAPATIVCDGDDQRARALDHLRQAVAAGRQAFVVCPVRERARRAGTVTALARYASLRRELRPARVGLVHGAMGGSEKTDTLRAFAAGAVDVLVATTVVELGIDVPNATLVVVEDADRFGLAQLHQIRGRVGRGAAAGLCLLMPSAEARQDEADGAAMARLREVAATADGFRLAELDLARRGCGDLFGTRQAGVPAFLTGDPRQALELVEIARREVEAILAADPALVSPAHGELARAARARAAAGDLFAAEAG